MKRPDIVLFMLDQLAARWLESPCDGVVPTPNLDRLRGARGDLHPLHRQQPDLHAGARHP